MTTSTRITQYIDSSNISKGELAERLFPSDCVIDCAVPQWFVDKLTERGFDNPASHFVTVYPNGTGKTAGRTRMVDGAVMPITDDGIYMVSILAQSA